jgi:hypothetical protein
MKIPVFLPVTREFGFRDEFAQDCLLQERVSELSVPGRRSGRPSPTDRDRAVIRGAAVNRTALCILKTDPHWYRAVREVTSISGRTGSATSGKPPEIALGRSGDCWGSISASDRLTEMLVAGP